MGSAALTWQDVDAPAPETGAVKGQADRRIDGGSGDLFIADRRSVPVFLDANTGSPAPGILGPPVRYYMVVTAFGERHHLNRLLKVEVARGEDVPCVVFAPALGVGGCGDTLDAALNDMGETAVMLLEDYSAVPPGDRDASISDALGKLETYLPVSR